MGTVKRPINRSIIMVCALFILLLCNISCSFTYFTYRKNYKVYTRRMYDKYVDDMYDRYESELESVVSYADSLIDHDDMCNCSKTLIESERYKKTQEDFNNLLETFHDIHFVYLMKVYEEYEVDPDNPVELIVIVTANTEEDKLYEEDLHLGDGEADWYPKEVAAEFRRILKGHKDVYYENESEWGVDYTLARPVKDSNGEYYGLLCADISIDEINSAIAELNKTIDSTRHAVYRSIVTTILSIVIPGLLFMTLLVLWMRKNVITPIKQLENSVTEFAESSAGVRNPEDLKYIHPDIHTKNEVESLANAYEKLSIDMKDYINGITAAENEARNLKEHVNEINVIAYRDALTHVKNKSAYEEKHTQLNKDIVNGTAEFGIVMADINSLKDINDKYGHEKGDEYIKGACKIISDIYHHSPVYRIGGDEFVVILQNRDYQNRENLLDEARRAFADAMSNTDAEPWNRYSAALGMAIYEIDDDFDKVFARADHMMYEEKAKIKAKYKVE